MDPPSSLPSGYTLTKDVVEAFCLPGTWKNLISLLKEVQIKDSTNNIKTFPRLEAVLGNIVSILGYDTLHRFSLFDPNPNALHYLFAHHIASHGRHITLNLDLGIESAIKILYDSLQYDILTPRDMADNKTVPSTSSWILHLHGKHGETPSNLGLTLENITKGIHDNSRRLITKALLDSKLIIFAGYSGSDVFDVNPFFASLANQHDFSGKSVIWIDYSDDYKDCVSYIQSKNNLPILESLSKCNAQNYVWTGPTRSFINKLRKHWSLPKPPPCSRLGSVPNFDKNVPDWQRRLVTGKIFASMGLGKQAFDVIVSDNVYHLGSISVIEHQSHFVDAYSWYCQGQQDLLEMTPVNRILYIRNEACREQGLYKNASKITEHLIAQTDLDIMLIHERRASDAWLAGSLLRAKKEFKTALAYGQSRLGKSYHFDTLYVESLRAYMQLCRDFGHIPVVGKYLMRKHIAYPVDLICQAEHLQNIILNSPYDRSHIARLFAWEGHTLKKLKQKLPSPLLDESTIITVFDETDNILGTINATRSQIWSQLSQGKAVQKELLFKVLNLSRAIGDNPGIVKAHHLLAVSGRLEKQCLGNFIDALMRTQWLDTRRFYEATRFLWFICYGALKRLFACRHTL